MENVAAYIDAYNLYHSLKEQNWKRYYWLDIPSLLQGLLNDNQKLTTVYYFTSTSPKPGSKRRQSIYIEALETIALRNQILFKTVRGRFVPEDIVCNTCNDFAVCKGCDELVTIYHEKETDVNISVQMISDAYQELFETVLLLTADSDQVGTIKTIKDYERKVGVILPPGRGSKHLECVADFHLHISQNDLGKNQLPEIISKRDNYQLIKPSEWN